MDAGRVPGCSTSLEVPTSVRTESGEAESGAVYSVAVALSPFSHVEKLFMLL